MWTSPTLSDFKSRFVRDFPYAPAKDQDNPDYVMDADINAAMAQAGGSFNTRLGAADAQMTEMYLLLSAFYLVENIKTAEKGIRSQAEFLASSKSVGGVSVSYQIPEAYSQDPFLSQFTANRYGMQYLAIALPFVVGGARAIWGATTNA